jgi:hypothetical protein
VGRRKLKILSKREERQKGKKNQSFPFPPPQREYRSINEIKISLIEAAIR